jgi:predicted RNA methylase
MAEVLQKAAQESASTPYIIVDLGSGRGELSRKIALSLPVAKVIGIEISPWPTAQAKFIQHLFGPENISYQCLDFWTYDCSSIDAVVFYLSARIAQKVGEKLYKELKTGSIVISHTFPLGSEWQEQEVIEFRTLFKETIFVYKKA